MRKNAYLCANKQTATRYLTTLLIQKIYVKKTNEYQSDACVGPTADSGLSARATDRQGQREGLERRGRHRCQHH